MQIICREGQSHLRGVGRDLSALPAVGSVLGQAWPVMILSPEHTGEELVTVLAYEGDLLNATPGSAQYVDAVSSKLFPVRELGLWRGSLLF